MKTYIAYGSNMNVEQMKWRCPDAEVIATGMLEGWKLTFRGHSKGGVATIEPDEGSSVPVVIWKISALDERNLDRYEGFPHLYTKENVRAVCRGRKPIEGMAYIMTKGYKLSGPSGYYLDVIAQGYDHFGMDATELLQAAVECGIKEAAYEKDHDNR